MNIIKDDIPYDLQNLVDIVGTNNYLKICKMYGGTTVYIPVYHKAVMNERNRNIVKDYNGKNIENLRMKYNISTNQIKRILKNEKMQ